MSTAYPCRPKSGGNAIDLARPTGLTNSWTEEPHPVSIVLAKGHPGISPRRRVINGPRNSYSKRSCHVPPHIEKFVTQDTALAHAPFTEPMILPQTPSALDPITNCSLTIRREYGDNINRYQGSRFWRSPVFRQGKPGCCSI